MIKNSVLTTALMILNSGLISDAMAEPPTADRKPFQATIKPVFIDGANQGSSTLGIDYNFNYLRSLGGRGRTSYGQPTISAEDADIIITEGELSSRLRGTLTASKESNPNKLVDFSGAWHYVISTVPAWYRFGAGVTYETDQSYENKQFSYGLNIAASKVSIFNNGDAGSIELSLGRVNPKNDAKRKAADGTLSDFSRLNFELSYSLNLNQNKMRSIDLNYRHYQEISPSNAIRAAGIDRNRLGLIRFNLEQGFFVQYSRGSLPFDQKSERAIKVGWTAKLE